MQTDWHCHGASLSLYIQNLDISRYYSCRYLQDFDFLYTFMVKFLWFISFYDRTRRWNAGCRIRGINDLNAWYILHKWWGKCSDMLWGASQILTKKNPSERNVMTCIDDIYARNIDKNRFLYPLLFQTTTRCDWWLLRTQESGHFWAAASAEWGVELQFKRRFPKITRIFHNHREGPY